MPDTGRPKRWAFVLGMLLALSIVVIVQFVFLTLLRGDVNEARTRLSALEVKDVAEDASQRTAEVATCYASARGRPGLIVILRLLAQTAERDPIASAAVDQFIMAYENSTPTIAECDKRATDNGFDPEDFPAANRGEEGNGR